MKKRQCDVCGCYLEEVQYEPNLGFDLCIKHHDEVIEHMREFVHDLFLQKFPRPYLLADCHEKKHDITRLQTRPFADIEEVCLTCGLHEVYHFKTEWELRMEEKGQ